MIDCYWVILEITDQLEQVRTWFSSKDNIGFAVDNGEKGLLKRMETLTITQAIKTGHTGRS